MPTSPKHDNFLANAVKPTPKSKDRHITYADGFRFGFGFFIAGLLISLIVSGLSWGLVVGLHIH
jgi:hypothetical protein